VEVTKIIKIIPGNSTLRLVYETGDQYNHKFPAKIIIEGLYHKGVYNYPNNEFIGGHYKILFSEDYEINKVVECENQLTSLAVPGSYIGTIHELDYANC